MISRVLLILTFFGLVSACSPDQVESTYTTYEEASEDGFLEKGWIPEAAISSSMVNIFCFSDAPSNSCIFGFQADYEDIELLRSQLQFTDQFIQLPANIKQPSWWIDILTNSENYILQTDEGVVFIAIQNEGNTVLGWRN